MSARSFLILLAMLMLGNLQPACASQSITSAKSGVKKQKSVSHVPRTSAKKKRSYHHVISARLIPPPPAYMPSILPELYYRQQNPQEDEGDEEEVADKPQRPRYVQYFGPGNLPRALQARNGVSTWSQTR